jgi:hypothetical protein
MSTAAPTAAPRMKIAGELTLSTRYRYSVLASVILSAAGTYLPVRSGHAPADYEYFDPIIG